MCGNDWANDVYTRTYTVTPVNGGGFQVSELFNGTFTTIAGHSPNGPCDGSAEVGGGVPGTMYGDFAFFVPPGHDFNAPAVCPAQCTTTDFFSTFFGEDVTAADNDVNGTNSFGFGWQFHYRTAGNGNWDNTDHGNAGNIN